MYAAGLPVPRPVAARAVRLGPIYQADIVTVLLPDTRPLSSYLADGGVGNEVWPAIGRMLREFHRYGIDHPDLTAHNILIDSSQRSFLLDFDNAVRREPGPWCANGLKRLQRSLRKVALETGTEFDLDSWERLSRAYAEAGS
jgi:3-deoxy-D-manno-octulosonic acid kinase